MNFRNYLRQSERPTAASVRRGIKNPRARRNRQAGHFDHRESRTSDDPGGRTVRELHYTEVRGSIEIAGEIIADERSDREVRQVITAIDKGGGGPGSGDLKHVP